MTEHQIETLLEIVELEARAAAAHGQVPKADQKRLAELKELLVSTASDRY